ncbi:hypothetical protein KEM60_01530 [Austwickia sp. TVS 96-490-7B]|nr:hypothetical protein [Austwickia sp. TVS 96-490-7B]
MHTTRRALTVSAFPSMGLISFGAAPMHTTSLLAAPTEHPLTGIEASHQGINRGLMAPLNIKLSAATPHIHQISR